MNRFTMPPQHIETRRLFVIVRLRPITGRKSHGTTVTHEHDIDWDDCLELAQAWCISQSEMIANFDDNCPVVWVGEIVNVWEVDEI